MSFKERIPPHFKLPPLLFPFPHPLPRFNLVPRLEGLYQTFFMVWMAHLGLGMLRVMSVAKNPKQHLTQGIRGNSVRQQGGTG